MARYSIADTTLTALGDAVREKTSETKVGYADTVTIDKEIARNETIEYYVPAGTRGIKVKKLADATGSTVIMDSHGNIWHDLGPTFSYKDTWETSGNIGSGFYFLHMSYSDGVNRRAFEFTCYDIEGNIIQGEQPIKNTMTPLQMAEAIEGLPPAPPESAFTITGNCTNKFAYGGWDWFIEQYGDKITTKDISACNFMFSNSNLTSIPFDINGGSSRIVYDNMFSSTTKLEKAPKISGKVESTNYMFAYCYHLREVSEEAVAGLDWSYIDTITSAYSAPRSYMFTRCYSLRKYPNSFLAHGNPVIYNGYSNYYELFNDCYVLDEVVDLPIVHRKASWTSSGFSNTFNNCYRLRKLTFETNEDGSPIKIDTWSKQTIDLSKSVGCAKFASQITDYNSRLTTATEITNNAETYEALKNNPDRWTTQFAYALYNKTSAVETINTLPDLSGGAGGNTIKFSAWAGEYTDGGAINTMTEEEIAVATAKGWTVSFA